MRIAQIALIVPMVLGAGSLLFTWAAERRSRMFSMIRTGKDWRSQASVGETRRPS
jgi:hypothetical protein